MSFLKFWERDEKTQENVSLCESGLDEELVLCGDGRCDSPRSSAQFYSYSLMDAKNNAIVHTDTVMRKEVSFNVHIKYSGNSLI